MPSRVPRRREGRPGWRAQGSPALASRRALGAFALLLAAPVANGAAAAPVASSSTSATPPFALEQLLAAPFPLAPVAAARAERIAWLTLERGSRSLWTAAAPGFAPVRLVEHAGDDGIPMGDLALTADGSLLVYTRGGSPNAAGDTPNPASLPAGAPQQIWAVSTAGGPAWKVADGARPTLSPDGTRVMYLRSGTVREVALLPGAESAALFVVRGGAESLRYSPDAGRVAFVSSRGDHSFVGIYHRAGGRIVWLSPGVDFDRFPTWSPDGRRVAFQRAPGRRAGEVPDLLATHPFAVWIADPESGEAHELWSSGPDGGGFAQDFDEPLRWAAPDRLLVTSEHEGWVHLYRLDLAGGAALDLTPGPGEVEASVLAGDGSFVVVASNHGERERRSLWRIPIAGGAPEPLTARAEATAEGTIDTDPVLLGGGRAVAYRSATPRRPPAITVRQLAGGTPQRVFPLALPAGFPEHALVVPQAVRLQAADGQAITGHLLVPAGARAGDRRPAVVFLHGGPFRQMLAGWHPRGYYANAYAFNQFLASRGYLVLALNFRSGIGYGQAFRQAAGQGPRGAAEYQDVLAAARYLQQRSEVDEQRIGLWGGSYGGFLTALGLARDSATFAAGVDLHGVHDWAMRAETFPTPGGWWGMEEADYALGRQSSPVAAIDGWRSPVLLVHGDDDRNVQFSETVDLAQRLRQRGVHVEVLVFPDEVHSFLRHASWLRTFQAAASFFDRFLTGSGR